MNSSQTTSSSSSGSSKSGYNFRSSKDLGQDDFLQCKKSKSASRTIVSTTRSSSSPSPVFQIFPVKPKTLTRIPSIKMYPRKYSDRCLPCLYKTFTEPERSKCELPMTTLSSIVKEPFVEISESDTSSVSLRDLKISDFESLVFYERSNLESPSLPTQVILEKEDVNKTTEVSQDNESILSKDQSPLTKVTDTKKVSIRSGSIQSTDISKPSTPSGQSSESEDFRSEVISGALNTSKYLAPCHAPVVWKPSLDSLKALRSRKATSMQARASALIAKSDDDSELEDSMDESQNTRKRNKKPSCKTATIQSPDLKIKCDKEADSKSKAVDDDSDLRERRKKFVRTKTVTGEIDVFNTVESEKEKKFRFVRAQTYMNLTPNLDASREIPVNFNLKDSVENSITISEGSIGLKKESTEGKSLELTKEEQEFLDIFERCLEEGESPGMILIKWCDRYSELVLKARKGDTDPDSKRALKISLKLLKLLAESRRYLNADKLSPELEFSSEQPTSCNSRQLRRVLPLESYNLVASILKMPQWYPKKSVENNVINVKGRDLSKDSITRRRSSEFNLSLIVHPPSRTETSLDKKPNVSKRLNPYAMFLVKPRRKVVTWRPLNKRDLKGYDPDATLERRANKITDKICHDFCEWLRGLNGSLERIDEEILKDMFQIIFDAEACKAMQAIYKEMPTVPKSIALIRNCPEATEFKMTKRELLKDIKVESKPKKTFAFGTSLPKRLRFIPSRHSNWLKCKNVPHDLETMDAVWNGIKNLDSVRGFADWLETHLNLPKDLSSNKLSVSQFSQDVIIGDDISNE